MSENYKPEISVVRGVTFAASPTPWWKVEDGNFTQEPRALLVRGVPMVGERVRHEKGNEFTVVGHQVVGNGHVNLIASDWLFYPATQCRPAPDEDEALVDRVMEAIRTAGHMWQDDPRCGMSLSELEARAAIRAMKEGA